MSLQKKEFKAEEYVYAKLKESIFKGEYKSGDRLIEQELSEKYDVSRTPVRKALQKLQSEMILECSGGKAGMQIYLAKKEDIIELTDLRIALECLALAYAMKHGNKERFFSMAGSIHRMKKACKENDFTKIMEEDEKFHLSLYRASGSHWVEKIGSQVNGCLRVYNQLFLREQNSWEDAANEHMMLYNLIMSGDVVAAREMLTYHIGFNKWNQGGIMKEILGFDDV